MKDLPFVSVIMPIRNEREFITQTLCAVLSQDYPQNRFEVIVVDGMSTDGTREIVKTLTQGKINAHVLDNPALTVPFALNQGIRASRGDVIFRVDGHTVIEADYLRRSLQVLEETGADDVGGPMRAVGTSFVARAISIAVSSPFGVGGAWFRYANRAGWTDTVWLGAYRRDVFDRVGYFDEELSRNQDDEFDFRLVRAGGRIWLDPQIRSIYYSRPTLAALWQQYFDYGYWKVRVVQKHRRPASWRHVVPAFLVMGLTFSPVLFVLSAWPVSWLIPLLYLCFLLFGSAAAASKSGWRYGFVLPLAFATIHLAYGAGFWVGIFRSIIHSR